ncbi:glycosyltransferase 87 family protein [Nocardia sp. 348MFTsu5.1]|uniref:glycosyltransferase 87 family protein n=1 Tax=Nocardia sp. 348MFTsu5.1 TaxID=1172185 RepID=UPI00037BBEBE|nr:glycosyltransferase 87 family protein [Nocardia sp. 348MFTsu5.1]
MTTHDATTPATRIRFPTSPWLLAGFVVGAIIAVYVQLTIIPLDTKVFGLFDNQVDLRVYRQGALHLMDGQPLYEAPMLRNGLLYTYTPFSTIVFLPFAWLDVPSAEVLWTALIFATLFYVIVASFRSLRYRVDWRLLIVSASLVCASTLLEPVRTTIWYGQINVFLMAIVLWDLLRPDGSRLKGIGVGIAAGVKLTPGFFILYLAITRRRRAIVVAAGTIVATMVIGFLATPGQSWKYWTDRVINSDRVGPTDAPSNQSIKGALATAFGTADPNQVLWAVLAVAAMALGMSAAYVAHRHGQELLALCLTGMTATTVSPFSWGHHWVWFVPLLVYLVHLPIAAWRSGRTGLLAVTLLLPAALYATVFIWRNHVPGGAMGFKPYYATGMFMTRFPDWLRWFSSEPYLWVFGVTATATLILWGPAEFRRFRTPKPAPRLDRSPLADPASVGPRR